MSTTGGLEDGAEDETTRNPRRNNRKTRKRTATSKQKACIRTALYTCITTRQLKAVLELGDEFEKRDAEGGNEETNENIDALIGNLSKNKTGKRVKGSMTIRSRPRPRKNQSDGTFGRIVGHETTEFDFATINIGSFTVNGGGAASASRAAVRFCFANSVATYEFIHDEGEERYKVGYSIPFNDIASITFSRKIVYLNLKNPAKQTFCTLQGVVNGVANSTILSDAGNFDVSNGQLESSLLHTIHLKRGNTKAWEEALLAGNRAIFEPIIQSTIVKPIDHGSVDLAESETVSSRERLAMLKSVGRGSSLSSLEEHTNLKRFEAAYDSGVFEPVHISSGMQLFNSATVDSANNCNQASEFINGGHHTYSCQDPTSTGMFAEYCPPRLGRLLSFEELASSILTSPVQRPQEPKLTGPSITKFSDGSGHSGAEINTFEDSGYGCREYKEELNDRQMDTSFQTPANSSSTLADDETNDAQSGLLKMERFESVIDGVDDLIENRPNNIDQQNSCEVDGEVEALKEANSRCAPQSKVPLYWLGEIDMDTLGDDDAAPMDTI